MSGPSMVERLQRFEDRNEVFHGDSLGQGWWVAVEPVDMLREAIDLIRAARLEMTPSFIPTTPVECEHGYDWCPTCDVTPGSEPEGES